MAGTILKWLKWSIALLRHVAEMHPGTITFGVSAPPAELPRHPARAPEPGPAPRGATPPQASMAPPARRRSSNANTTTG